jgi:hypothetical protein
LIAQVYIPDEAGDGYTMTLDDEGKWVCTQFPEVAEAFNQLHGGTFQEWNGPSGAWQANDAARRLNGEVIYLRS